MRFIHYTGEIRLLLIERRRSLLRDITRPRTSGSLFRDGDLQNWDPGLLASSGLQGFPSGCGLYFQPIPEGGAVLKD